MTREESLNLAKYKETPYYFQRLINKIYDEFDLELEELENTKNTVIEEIEYAIAKPEYANVYLNNALRFLRNK